MTTSTKPTQADGPTLATGTTEPVEAQSRRRGRWLLALAWVAGAALGGGCSHEHLNPNYGMAYNAWFTAQHVRHQPADSDATQRALGGLDAQEAASISKNYRKTSGGQADTGQGQMVMIGQARGGTESYTPPPSVPGGN
ncbi:MAG TPA: hypothetical protein VFG23_25260 [Polyangia bacterium]|nr:hypothetical protein [Polyangia bacterium]